MGVKGLSTFVDNNHRLLSVHKLHDCGLVIDANNFMYYLFFHHKLSFKFGGDYDQYARKCKHFFNTLRMCNVKPYVVFDGGYDPDDRKLPTILKRRMSRIMDVDRLFHKGRSNLLPILAIETFKQTLEELDVPHVSCQFEADREIAVLAHRWACPVLSNDSDFFIYSLEGGVIPMDYVNLTLCVCDQKTDECVPLEPSLNLTDNHFIYIPVKLYHYSRFVEKYPPDVQHLVLPVFATLLGNDYVDENDLLRFYKYAGVPLGEKLKFYIKDKESSRFITSLQWLDRIKEKENVFDGVVECIPKDNTEEVKVKLERSLNDYCNIAEFASIDLQEYFDHYEKPKAERNLQMFLFPELIDYYNKAVPGWLVSSLRRCKVGIASQNAIVLHRVIQYCQIELLGKPTSYHCSKRIREFSYGLFLPSMTSDISDQKPSCETHIIEYDRKDKDIKKFYVRPVWTTAEQSNEWNINTSPNEENKNDRLKILFEAFQYTDHPAINAHSFSSTILLIICMLCMWVREADPKISKCALMSMLSTILYLNIRAMHWYTNKVKSGQGNPTKQLVIDDLENVYSESSDYQIQRFIDRLEKYTKKPEIRDKKPKDYKIVHGFSQFQAILMDTILLDQLLDCPVPILNPAFIFSGTTVYNLCLELDHRPKPEVFVEELMVRHSPLHNFFTNILNTVVAVCSNSSMDPRNERVSKKPKRKKRKTKSGRLKERRTEVNSDSDSPDTVTSDLAMDNRFALLKMDT